MKRVLTTVAAVLMLSAVVASAQNTVRTTSSMYSQPESRVEIIPMVGYAWTMSKDVVSNGFPGELDFDDNVYYGGALDFTVSPPGSMKKAQVRLMYRREDSDVTLRGFSQDVSGSATLEYWQIGGVTGLDKGRSMPFATVSLGGTRLAANGDDVWKFSMIFGLGVKLYTSPKLGIMLQGNWPITFTDSWGGVTVGTGGAGVAIGGTGISQLDLGAGLIIRL